MSSEDANLHTNPEIGRSLERARTQRGLTLRQVEEATKIRARYLHDLEHENFDVLPAVYVLGSLKTYADFLGLDGEALARELKARQEPPPEESDATPEEPARGERGGFLAALGSLPVIRGREEVEDDDEGAAPAAAVLGYGPRLYLGLGAVLILVLAVALGTAFGDGGQPEVSQLREPAVSEAPSRITFLGEAQDGADERNQDAGGEDGRSGEQSESPGEEKDQAEKSDREEQAEDTGDVAVTLPTSPPASASASASAPATSSPAATAPADASSAATAPASSAPAEPETTTPDVAPGPVDEPAADRPAPVAGSSDGSGGSGAGGLDRARLADGIFSEVRSATGFAR